MGLGLCSPDGPRRCMLNGDRDEGMTACPHCGFGGVSSERKPEAKEKSFGEKMPQKPLRDSAPRDNTS